MKRRLWGITVVLLIFSIFIISWKAEDIKETKKVAAKSVKASPKAQFVQYIDEIYNNAQLSDAGLDMAVFQKAVTGYFNL
ncbi:MAG: murein L,D-transpeptidase catalytic domain family protein, partial [Mucilaginibacter sp.]|nr:murein L,D-transpeptidase catalytic domain family protein [Mucilaginibacter sp.]